MHACQHARACKYAAPLVIVKMMMISKWEADACAGIQPTNLHDEADGDIDGDEDDGDHDDVDDQQPRY